MERGPGHGGTLWDMATAEFEWKSPKEVAEIVGVDEKTVRRWCGKGLIDAELTPDNASWRIKCRAKDGFPVRL